MNGQDFDLLLQLCEYPFFSPFPEEKAHTIIQTLHGLPQPLDLLEEHALGPLAWQRLKQHLYGSLRSGMKLLAWRHQRANRVRMGILSKVIAALEDSGCCPIILKGSGLIASGIYPSLELRPMRDIDILIKANRRHEGAEILRAFGFQFEPSHRFASYPFCHQLPNAQLVVDHVIFSLELHVKLHSYDGRRGIAPKILYQHAVSVHHADTETTYRILDLEMQLLHLWRHQLCMSFVPRFIGYLDAILVASLVPTEQWSTYQRDWPGMVNYIGMLFNLFDIAHPAFPKDTGTAPGFGYGLPSFRDTFTGLKEKNRLFLRPTDWWLRAFYNVPEGQLLWPVVFLRHPLNLLQRIFYKWCSYLSSFFVRGNY